MIEDIKISLNLAKGVVDLAKNLKDLSEKSGSLELKGAASELRSQTIDLKEKVNDMKDEILDLRQKLELKEKLTFNGKIFEYKDNGKKVYICNGCEANGKYTHMSEKKIIWAPIG